MVISTVQDVLNLLRDHPEVCEALSFEAFILFIRLLQSFRPVLHWHEKSWRTGPPPVLPDNILGFLAAALEVDTVTHPTILPTCWTAVASYVWETEIDIASLYSTETTELFLRYGRGYNITFLDRYPSQYTCDWDVCQRTHPQPQYLSLRPPIHCTRYTKEYGPLPMKTYWARCESCRSKYYPEYTVRPDEKQRVYPSGIPREIRVTEHIYVESSLCDLWTASMHCAWVSATNNCKIYNSLFPFIDDKDPAWAGFPKPTMDSSLVWGGFFMLALLREHDELGLDMLMPDEGSYNDRLDELLDWRNGRMVGTGQEEWSHYCDLCCERTRQADGTWKYMRVMVTDGVTVGRPCCDAHNCHNRLENTKERWCQKHKDEGLDKQCVVVNCRQLRDKGFQTCGQQDHRDLEHTGKEEHTAFFQLKQRLLAQGPGKSESGNSAPRARFGRRRTHNEQLAVPTCGVIVARATFNGAEALSATRQFLKAVYPTEASLPDVIFYDNACGLRRHLRTQRDHHFDRCIMPVDVFHMKTKHKPGNQLCETDCNAVNYPALYNAITKKWRFNSSAAEMVNAWFGEFQSIAREMRKERYEFFLDEMIKQRNHLTVKQLQAQRRKPGRLPKEELLAV
ncbi:hypothetical protein PENSPDRAFT_625680 [Peniophora sp. CONT]|nr:hypothetical protein PENSPDRAFT_625680 [Peniophora sp. CONT]